MSAVSDPRLNTMKRLATLLLFWGINSPFLCASKPNVIDELERLGLRDSTAIVFTTDHG